MKRFKKTKIPDVVITRLSFYRRYLDSLLDKNIQTLTSKRLGDKIQVMPEQVRKDLAYFGQFGRRGKGYNIRELYKVLTKILGSDRFWRVALVGAGNLGKALYFYPGFKREGFIISCIFDIDPKKVGKKWKNIVINHIKDLERVVRKMKIDIAIVSVPAQEAQRVVDILWRTGIKGILNFAPVCLAVPKYVKLRNANLAMELEHLGYFLSE